MPGVPWIKLWVGIFDDEKIKIIGQLPEGDTIILCWLRLLCLAGKSGKGGTVTVNETLAYTDEMLSSVWGVPVATVRLAVKTLGELGMIILGENGLIEIANWSRYQSVKSYEDVQEGWRLRKAKQRQIDVSRDKSRDVTPQEEEVEVERKKKKKKKNIREEFATQIDEVFDFFRKKTGSSVLSTTQALRSKINARLAEGYTVEQCKRAIAFSYGSKIDNPEQRQYIRIETIFSPSHFSGYLDAWGREMK